MKVTDAEHRMVDSIVWDLGTGESWLKETKLGSGAMAWQLGALDALAEDLGSILRTHMTAHNHLKLQLQGDLMSSPGLLWYYMHVVNRHACWQNTHAHTNK